MKIEVTQVTFRGDGKMLVAGTPIGDTTKVVIAEAPEEVAYGIAMALAGGLAVQAEPPDEAIVEILER